ncbi:MAG: hypothetical protein HC831_31105 [Chloroflexia bacterium]|nr:hypothetical protein [Chloroflexia bacterium]
MSKLKILMCLILFSGIKLVGQEYAVQSPNGKTTVKVNLEKILLISITHDGKVLLQPSVLSMELSDRILGDVPKLLKKEISSVDKILVPEVKVKAAKIRGKLQRITPAF